MINKLISLLRHVVEHLFAWFASVGIFLLAMNIPGSVRADTATNAYNSGLDAIHNKDYD